MLRSFSDTAIRSDERLISSRSWAAASSIRTSFAAKSRAMNSRSLDMELDAVSQGRRSEAIRARDGGARLIATGTTRPARPTTAFWCESFGLSLRQATASRAKREAQRRSTLSRTCSGRFGSVIGDSLRGSPINGTKAVRFAAGWVPRSFIQRLERLEDRIYGHGIFQSFGSTQCGTRGNRGGVGRPRCQNGSLLGQ